MRRRIRPYGICLPAAALLGCLFFTSCGVSLYDIAGGTRKSVTTHTLTVNYQYVGCYTPSSYSPLLVAVFGYYFTGNEPDLVIFSPSRISRSGTCTFTGLQELSYGLILFVDLNGDRWPSTGEPYAFYDRAAENPAEIQLDSDVSVSAYFDDTYRWVSGFYENFDDGVADNWVDDGSGMWSCPGVNYVMRGKMTDTYTTSYYDDDFGDFTYQVSVEQNAGDPSSRRGIFFRASDPRQFKSGNLKGYVLWIDSNRNWGFEWNYGDLFLTIASGTSSYLVPGIGSSNTIMVECFGQDIRIYFNGFGAPELSFVDDRSFQGKVGIFGLDRYSTGYPPAYSPDEFWFDDISVR